MMMEYDHGGGFQSSPYQTDAASSTSSTSRNAQTLTPVTIAQLLSAKQPVPDGSFKINHLEISQVMVVALVRDVQVQATNISYQLEDSSAYIQAKEWNNTGAGSAIPPISVLQYVQVVGQLRTFNQQRILMAFSIRPVVDLNQVTAHYLHCLAVHTSSSTTTTSTNMNSTAAAGSHKLQQQLVKAFPEATPIHLNILATLLEFPASIEGVHIEAALAPKLGMPLPRLKEALQHMMDQGWIYNTVSDDLIKVVNDRALRNAGSLSFSSLLYFLTLIITG